MSISYPKNEIVWVNYVNVNGEVSFILTSKQARDFYYLYEVLEDGKTYRLGRAKEPPELESKFNVFERLLTKRTEKDR